MKNPCIHAGALTTLMLFVLFCAPTVCAQPTAPNPEMGRDQARQMIERRMHEIEQQQQRLTHAMEMLESGQSLQEIRKAIEKSSPGAQNRKPVPTERVVEVLKATNPELHQRLEQLRKEHPERARQLLQRIKSERRLQELAELLKNNPEEFRVRAEQLSIERQAMQAAMRFVDASARGDEEGARQARQEARVLVGQLVEHQFTQQRKSFQRAEARLNRVRSELEQHQTDSDPIIDARLETLLRHAMSQATRRDNALERQTPNRRTPPNRNRQPRRNIP